RATRAPGLRSGAATMRRTLSCGPSSSRRSSKPTTKTGCQMLRPLEVLFETELPSYPLPADLERLYGRLGFSEPVVYSNFVSSLDGVVSLGVKPSAGSVISGKYPADRFVMGLLRSCADAVVVGAGTLRATP